MSYLGLGQTRTRGTPDPQLVAAMNASTAELRVMCQQGNQHACKLLGLDMQDTPEDIAARADWRDAQAQRDREHAALKAEEAGLNPALVDAIRHGRDVQYRPDWDQGIDWMRGAARGKKTLAPALIVLGLGAAFLWFRR